MNTILSWLAQNALVVACCVPVVWLLCRVLRHRPAEQHLLWLLLLVKLITPPIITFHWSLPALSIARSEPAATEAEVALPAADLSADSPSMAPAPALSVENAMPDIFSRPVEEIASSQVTLTPPISPAQVTDLAPSDAPIDITASNVASPDKVFPLMRWIVPSIFIAWAIGTVIAVATALRRIIYLSKLLRSAVPSNSHLHAMVQKQAARLKLSRPHVKVVNGTTGPFVACLGRPCLVWPDSMSDQHTVVRSGAIIAHELAHIRRGDHYVMWFELAAGLIWWWNPFYWCIRRGLHESREMACDAMALQGAAVEPREYAELLLAISAAATPNSYAAPAFGAGNLFRGTLKRRLEMVFNERASGRVSVAGCFLVMAFAAMTLPHWTFGQQPAPAADEPAADQPAATPVPAISIAVEAAPAAAAPQTDTVPVPPPQPTEPPQPSAAPPSAPLAPAAVPSPADVQGEQGEQVQEFTLEGGAKLRISRGNDNFIYVQVTDGDRVTQHVIGPIGAGSTASRATRTAPRLFSRTAPSPTPPAVVPSVRYMRPGEQAVPARVPSIVSVPAQQPLTAARTVQQVVQVPGEQIELMRVDCSLAEIGVRKTQVEYESLKEMHAKNPESVSTKQLQLAELEMQEAELKVRRCRLMLEAAEQRQAGSGAQAR